MQNRVIIHSDLNCFFASVEMMLNPELRKKPMAVCGSTEERHGIILAKSWDAKMCGVKTGMPRWQAQKLCPDIVLVPPQYDEYLKYSKLVRKIYDQYTDQVEPYGIDECWLDVTGSERIYGKGIEIAQNIKERIKKELDLTVSMGVSYNKIFAKLGSDVNIPDNIRVITRETFQKEAWRLPVNELIFVGRATTKKLRYYGINTIGDLAKSSPTFLKSLLGINGMLLWKYANGLDESTVNSTEFVYPAKSIGHGVTLTSDLTNQEEVHRIILHLSQRISSQLHNLNLSASAVRIAIRDKDLMFATFQTNLYKATQSFKEIADSISVLFDTNYYFVKPIRSISVGVFKLKNVNIPTQLALFDIDESSKLAEFDLYQSENLTKLDDAVFKIRQRFGTSAILPASLLNQSKLPLIESSIGMPHPITR